MKKLFTLVLLSIILFALRTENTYAAGCTPIYGGGESCPDYSFSIQKHVQKPGKNGGDFVNNLSINDPKYAPNQNVTFQKLKIQVLRKSQQLQLQMYFLNI